MHKKLFKIIKKYWILFMTFFSITFFTFITLTNVLGYSKALDEHSKTYSDNTVELSASNGFDKIDLKGLLDFLEKDDDAYVSASLVPKLNDEYNVYGIFKQEKSNVKIPLTDGREISSEEYNKNENVALIKDNIFNSLKEAGKLKKINNENYFEYCGQQYKIVGIIDSNKNDKLMDVYININSMLDNTNISTSLLGYIFVYDAGERTKDNINELSKKYPDVEFKMNDLIKGQEALLYSVNINKIYIIGTVLLIIVCILTIINITSYWINAEKKEFGIRKLIGASNGKIVILLICRYIIITNLAMALGFISFEISKNIKILNDLITVKTSFYTDLMGLVILEVILVILVFIVLIKPVYKICILQINSVIRGEDK